MSRMFDTALLELREMTLRMAGLAEAILAKAVRAVMERRPDFGRAVQQDDLEIDRLDVAIDERVMRALALQAPVAEGLRQVIAIKMITTDIERIGDIARNIGKSAIRLADRPAITLPARLGDLADEACQLLKAALDSFADIDAQKARAVLAGDDQVDEDQDKVVREALEEIAAHPEISSQEIDLILIAKNLERIGDHATNIAESVVLAAEALNLKHREKLGR